MRSRRKRRARGPAKRHIPPDRATNPMIPYLHGLAAMSDERWDEAIESLERFLGMATDPTDRQAAYQNLGACYLSLERYDDALAMLDEVVRLAPNDPDPIHSRGIVLACGGRIAEAIATFESLARRWPRQAQEYDTRHAIRRLRQEQSGKTSDKVFLFEHLQEQVQHNVELGDYHLVERKARRMIAAAPGRPEGHFALGLACTEQGRYPEALDAYLAAHALDAKNEPTLYNLGHVHLKMDEPAQALLWLERALRRQRKKPATLYQLGVACERLGRRDEAIDWWRRVLKVKPDHYLAQQRLHEMGEGPEPREPPLPPSSQRLHTMLPIVKARMWQPQVYRNGSITLTWDGAVGYVLEDEENPRNATVYAGGPFQIAYVEHEEDILDLMGLIKLLLVQVNGLNTRDVAILVYYADDSAFSYQARFRRKKRAEFDADGHFVVTEAPRLFKLRIDSDLSTPYGDPMQGMLVYLNQGSKPGVMVSTLGLNP